MPAVSVIIPSYNCAEFLPDAVASIRAQSFTDWEIVIVDDGSTDPTPELLEGYGGDAQIRCLSQGNCGPSAARNAGVRAARGKYIAFLDADDVYDRRALELMKTATDEAGACWCIVDFLRSGEGSQRVVSSRFPQGDLFLEILKGNFIEGGVFFHRETFIEVGMLDEQLRGREDWELFIRLIAAGKRFAYVGEPLYHYRWRPTSATRDRRKMAVNTEMLLRKHHKQLADAGNREAAKIYAANLWSLARCYQNDLGDRSRAWACARESMAYDADFGRMIHPLLHRLKQWVGLRSSLA